MSATSGYQPRIASFDDVHCALDFDFANLSMIEVEDGFVAVDTGSTPQIAEQVLAEWQRLANGPLRALIYTHAHTDHIGGAAAFPLSSASGASVPIWGHRLFLHEIDQTQLLPNAYYRRAALQFGFALSEKDAESCGIGRPLRTGQAVRSPVIPPTRTFSERTEFEVGGTTFVLQSAPGETDDHLFVWLPERRVLFAGDNIYRGFPNLYSIRGVPPRPVRTWIDSLDAMRRLVPRPELMIMGHTEPVQGADAVYATLTDYRDAIAFVHDSVLRGINNGQTPDDLVEEIRLPRHLADSPFLRECYGTLQAAIRGIYGGYMGWFDGRAANLDPATDLEVAGWLSDELGGPDSLISCVQRAMDAGELRRAAWFCQLLLRSKPGNADAREAMASILTRMADRSDNPLERHWRQTEAEELRGRIEVPDRPRINGETVIAQPAEQLLRLLPSRLNPETTSRLMMKIGFDFTDTERCFTLHVRRGVGEVSPGLDDPDLLIRTTEPEFKRVFIAGDHGPRNPEFWRAMEFRVPESGLHGQFRRLMRLARLGKIFVPP